VNPKVAQLLSHGIVGLAAAAVGLLIHRLLDKPIARRLQLIGSGPTG
jgi:hypothetical protein